MSHSKRGLDPQTRERLLSEPHENLRKWMTEAAELGANFGEANFGAFNFGGRIMEALERQLRSLQGCGIPLSDLIVPAEFRQFFQNDQETIEYMEEFVTDLNLMSPEQFWKMSPVEFEQKLDKYWRKQKMKMERDRVIAKKIAATDRATASPAESLAPKPRGRPSKIPPERKERALAAKAKGATNRELAQILYGCQYPSDQQRRSAPTILRHYRKSLPKK